MIVVKVNLARDSVKGPKYRLCCVHEAYNEWIELEKKTNEYRSIYVRSHMNFVQQNPT